MHAVLDKLPVCPTNKPGDSSQSAHPSPGSSMEGYQQRIAAGSLNDNGSGSPRGDR